MSLLKGPSYFSPMNHLERLKQRTNLVFQKMVEKKDIPDRKDLIWTNDDWTRFQKNLKNNDKTKYFLQLWSMPKREAFTLNFYERFVLAQKVFEIREKIFERYPERAKDFAVKVLIRSLADQSEGEANKFYFVV